MPEIIETPGESRTTIESEPGRVVRVNRGLSGATIAAIITVAVVAAIAVTMLIMNNQQQQRDTEQAREQANAAQSQASQAQTQAGIAQDQANAAQSDAAQANAAANAARQNQSPVVVVPPATAPVVVPPVTDNVTTDIDVSTKLLTDPLLQSYTIDVKLDNGTVTLRGAVPNADLKARAERIAMSTKGVKHVNNMITVSNNG